jgi:hypothetical protein
MRSRVSRIALVAAMAMLIMSAGCLQTKPSSSSTSVTTTPVPAGAGTGGLDCTMGTYERAVAPWAQACEARASHTEGQKQEIWLAVNPTNPDDVVVGSKDLDPALSNHCVWNGVFYSKDGGHHWNSSFVGGKYLDRKPGSPYYGFACNTDPMGAFGADGTLYWVVEMYNFGGDNGFGPAGPDPTSGRGVLQPGWKLLMAISHDGGATFADSDTVTLEYGDGVAALNDYSRITINPVTGTVVPVINTYFPGAGSNAFGAVTAQVPAPTSGEACSVLPFRGNSPPQPAPIPPTVVVGTSNPGNLNCDAIAANANGTIVLATSGSALGGGPYQEWFSRSTDDAASFSDAGAGFERAPIPGRFSESQYRTGTNFEMVFDNTNSTHRGTLYVLTAERNPARSDDADIFVRSSTNDGRTWTAPVRVNHDNTTAHQFMGNIAVARDGSVHAFFMDKSQDPAGKLIGITHAWSADGGLDWTTERVTSVPFDGDLGKHQEGFPFIGDYTGIGAAGNVVYGGFPDASNGKTTVVAVARVNLT